MFEKKHFKSHSGKPLDWKIDCDSLTDDDLNTLAYLINERFYFGSVFGIPPGGLRLAKALEPYAQVGPRLVVDDVMTTGQSMQKVYQDGDIGVVIFERGECLTKESRPSWVHAMFISDGEW